MKITVDKCFKLDTDLQTQFLGNEVFPKPKYIRVDFVKRTINQVYYEDIYLLEPLSYYCITFEEDISSYNEDSKTHLIKTNHMFQENGLLFQFNMKEKKIFLFNSSQNIIYLQKGTKIGEVL